MTSTDIVDETAAVVAFAPKVPDEVLDAMANSAWDRIGTMSMEAVREMLEAAIAAAWYEGFDLVYRASEPIERLSRERDTGVPEGWCVLPLEPTREMCEAAVIRDGGWLEPYTAPRESGVAVDGDLSQEDADDLNRQSCEDARLDYIAMLSAAPQPPSVSDNPATGADADFLGKLYAIGRLEGSEGLSVTSDLMLTAHAKISRLSAELVEARKALQSSFLCVFLDGRNEHGSHVLEMPGTSINPDDVKDIVTTLEDQDLGFAEQIIKDAESLGHEVGHRVVTIWNLTRDPEWGVECEYLTINSVLTNLMCGTPEEQRAVLSPKNPSAEVPA